MIELSIFLGCFLLTYFGVRWFRVWTLRWGLLDLPNERSSHSVPTPRGGGLIMALVVLAAYFIAAAVVQFPVSWGFIAGSAIILAISWLDDVYSVSFAWRLLTHSIAAILVIYGNGDISGVRSPVGGGTIELGWIGAILSFFWIVWLINAYNFMDGIDGIAGVQAVTAGTGWFIIGIMSGSPAVYIVGGSVTFAAFAVLLHNWPPARIFMGDAGSAFLGFVFAAMPFMITAKSDLDGGYLIAGLLLVWLFVFDSVFTLFRRLFRREKVWQAHRQHLYQRLVLSGYSHMRVTLLYGVLSFLIMAATAFWAARPDNSSLVVLIAFVFLTSAYLLILCRRRNCLFGNVA